MSSQSCEDGDIRLRGGSTDLEGRVEICLGNVWGTVCNREWDENDASVVCRQIGFSSEGVYTSMSRQAGGMELLYQSGHLSLPL